MLTPVAKAFSTDIANEVTSLGIQVHGGMGFVEETGAAQLFRDARIAAIYEGTNGIQAIDLVTRKLPLGGGDAVAAHLDELRGIVDAVSASNDPAFGWTALRLGEALESLTRATQWLIGQTGKDADAALAGASPYLRLFGITTGGCYLAQQALAAIRLGEAAQARLALARFFAENFAVQAGGLERTVVEGAPGLIGADAALAVSCRQQHDGFRSTLNPSYICPMSTLLISHPACLEHLTPAGHPERPDRLRAIEQALEAEKFQQLAREQAPMADIETIALCHPMDYIVELREASPKEGMVRLDADTSMSPGTFEAALRAVGGAVLAVDEVLAKKTTNAFVATRPPGHHAETARPMGFCLFDNVAIAARYAQKQHGIARAAIVDFDVHHGNGSQEIFWADKSVMYCSTHQMPLFPGSGAVIESGTHNTVVNAPLRPGDGGEAFRAAFEDRILPRLREFRPELVIISAGFDAHMRDPLASINLTEDDFVWVTQKLMDVADHCAEGRVVSLLEGGYDLRALGNSVAAHVTTLMQG